MYHGFDISAYQSATWTREADFVFVKATEGLSYKSDRYASQIKGARSKAKVSGAYHFARPEAGSGKRQAEYFLSFAKPNAKEIVWLDLEASKLSQAQTHDFMAEFAETLKAEVPNKRGLYAGSGYASNNTGKGANKYYDLWWYPQYPSAYQLVPGTDMELARMLNRSHLLQEERVPLVAETTKWPPSVTPWLPSGLTIGWAKPHIWQFTDNWSGLDASVTTVDLVALVGGTAPAPKPPTKVSAPSGSPVLKRGSSGSRVKALQTALNKALGLKLSVDGDFGTKTESAVKALQARARLTKDGEYGPKSASALSKLLLG
jgi:hypothetical protein